MPLSTTAGPYNFVRVEGYTPAKGESTSVNRALVAPGYFDTMRIPLLEGRDFTLRDDAQGGAGDDRQPVLRPALLPRTESRGTKGARRRQVVYGGGPGAGQQVFQSRRSGQPPFLPGISAVLQCQPANSTFWCGPRANRRRRSRCCAAQSPKPDPNAAAFHAVPLAEYTEVVTFGQKVAANLMGALGLMCLLLAASGLYSVMSYTVSQRIPEIGIRIAMGACPVNVIAMVVRQGMALALAGMALGTVAAFAAARLVASMLFRVNSSDPATYLLAALFLCRRSPFRDLDPGLPRDPHRPHGGPTKITHRTHRTAGAFACEPGARNVRRRKRLRYVRLQRSFPWPSSGPQQGMKIRCGGPPAHPTATVP